MKTPLVLAAAAVLSLHARPAAAESLRVTLEPVSAVELKMRWRLPGEPSWRPSGDTVDGLAPGLYTLEVTSVAGCGPKQATNTVRVIRGATTHAVIEFAGDACPPPMLAKRRAADR